MNNFELVIKEEEEIDDFVSSQNEKFFKLHDWQERAIKFFFEHNCKSVFTVTTGAGKSICAITILKKILEIDPSINVLIIVPKNVILEKMWFPELMKHGFSMKDIGVYYGSIKENSQITITNMQNVLTLPYELFDFIIMDEIHNYLTDRLLELLKHPFKYKLGLSATIEREDKQHWRMLSYFDYNIFEYTPKEALEDGVLNNFYFYNVGVYMSPADYDVYLRLTQEIAFVSKAGGSFSRVMTGKAGIELKLKLLKKLNERKQLVLNYPSKFEVAKQICLQHKEEKTLCFNEYNITTTKLYWYLLEVGIKARILHSEVDKKEREQVLNDYNNNKFNILLATRILDEGYNLPSITIGIVMAGNSTAKQTIQRLGRCLRKKENPSILYQIFVKGTMEEEQSNERAKLFKSLCSEYKEYIFEKNKMVEI